MLYAALASFLVLGILVFTAFMRTTRYELLAPGVDPLQNRDLWIDPPGLKTKRLFYVLKLWAGFTFVVFTVAWFLTTFQIIRVDAAPLATPTLTPSSTPGVTLAPETPTLTPTITETPTPQNTPTLMIGPAFNSIEGMATLLSNLTATAQAQSTLTP